MIRRWTAGNTFQEFFACQFQGAPITHDLMCTIPDTNYHWTPWTSGNRPAGIKRSQQSCTLVS